MKQNMKCPLCKEELYSELGKGCRMCGMVLANQNGEFCSEYCRERYRFINKTDE